MNYQQKYLKYKTKYDNLFSQNGGLYVLHAYEKYLELQLETNDKIIRLNNITTLKLVNQPTTENPIKHYIVEFNSTDNALFNFKLLHSKNMKDVSIKHNNKFIEISGENIELLEDLDNTIQQHNRLYFLNEYMVDINTNKLNNLKYGFYFSNKILQDELVMYKRRIRHSTPHKNLQEITDEEAYNYGCHIYNELKIYLAIDSLDKFKSTYPNCDDQLYAKINLNTYQKNKYLEFYYGYNQKIWLGHQYYYFIGSLQKYDRHDNLIMFFRWLTNDLSEDMNGSFPLSEEPLRNYPSESE